MTEDAWTPEEGMMPRTLHMLAELVYCTEASLDGVGTGEFVTDICHDILLLDPRPPRARSILRHRRLIAMQSALETLLEFVLRMVSRAATAHLVEDAIRRLRLRTELSRLCIGEIRDVDHAAPDLRAELRGIWASRAEIAEDG